MKVDMRSVNGLDPTYVLSQVGIIKVIKMLKLLMIVMPYKLISSSHERT